MTRVSSDEIRDGRVWNGFDYQLQVWVKDGIILDCEHPEYMRRDGPCCDRNRYAGQSILDISEAEHREPEPELPEEPDVLRRVIKRHGSIRKSELEELPPDLEVVIKLGSGHRARVWASDAEVFIRLIGEHHVAEVFISASTLRTL